MSITDRKTVLVYQIGSLGDTLVAVPCYRSIRAYYGPRARIIVIHNIPADTRATPHQLLAGTGLVDEFLGYRRSGRELFDFFELWRRLSPLGADDVVYLAPAERHPRAVRRDRLFFKLAGVRKQIGFDAYDPQLFNARGDDGERKTIPHEAQLRLDRLKAHGFDAELSPQRARLPISDQAAAEVAAMVDGMRTLESRALIAVCPGANQSAKFWPIDRLAQIGLRLIETGRFEPVVIGGPSESAAGDELVSGWGAGFSVAGRLSVLQSAALIRQCRLLIGLDTGTTHLAAAVGTPIVALYADRDPVGQWLPLSDACEVHRISTPCGGCGLGVCNVDGHPCMTGISVDAVWQSIGKFINIDSAGGPAATAAVSGVAGQ